MDGDSKHIRDHEAGGKGGFLDRVARKSAGSLSRAIVPIPVPERFFATWEVSGDNSML